MKISQSELYRQKGCKNIFTNFNQLLKKMFTFTQKEESCTSFWYCPEFIVSFDVLVVTAIAVH